MICGIDFFCLQVGTRVCVEKGHMATVASVKRSTRGANFVDPYTEEEVDARYRLMLKPGEVCERRGVGVFLALLPTCTVQLYSSRYCSSTLEGQECIITAEYSVSYAIEPHSVSYNPHLYHACTSCECFSGTAHPDGACWTRSRTLNLR